MLVFFLSGFPKKPSRTKGALGSGLSSSFSTSFDPSSFLGSETSFFESSFLGDGGVVVAEGVGVGASGVGGGEGGVETGPPVEGGEIEGSPGRGEVFLVPPMIPPLPPGRSDIDRCWKLNREEDREDEEKEEEGRVLKDRIEEEEVEGMTEEVEGEERREIERCEVDIEEASLREVVEDAIRCMIGKIKEEGEGGRLRRGRRKGQGQVQLSARLSIRFRGPLLASVALFILLSFLFSLFLFCW